MKLKDGYGTYEILSGNEEYDDDIYLVRKGEDLQIKFKPANHYWLYAIYVNDVYVGASNVKTNYTLYNVNKKTTIVYWFSASSSSPKTGEDNQIFLWAAEEVISLLGMATIVYYLFRRKEQY